MPVTIHKQFQLKGHKGPVYALAKGDNNTFYSSGSDGIIAHWKTSGNADADGVARVSGQVFTLYHHNQSLLAGTMDGMLNVIDLTTGTETHAIQTQCDSVFDIIHIPNEKIFAIATKLGILNFYSEDFNLIHRFNISDSSLRCMALLPDENTLAIASSDHSIYLFDCRQKKIVHRIEGPEHSVFSIALSPDGQLLIAGSRDAGLYIYNIETGFSLEQKIAAHLFTINQVLFHPNGKYFFTAGRDKHIKIWDALTFQLLKVIDHEKHEGHINSVNRLLWMEESGLLISAGDDKMIMGWKIEF